MYICNILSDVKIKLKQYNCTMIVNLQYFIRCENQKSIIEICIFCNSLSEILFGVYKIYFFRFSHLAQEELKVTSVSVSKENPFKSFSLLLTLNVEIKFSPKKSEESTNSSILLLVKCKIQMM